MKSYEKVVISWVLHGKSPNSVLHGKSPNSADFFLNCKISSISIFLGFTTLLFANEPEWIIPILKRHPRTYDLPLPCFFYWRVMIANTKSWDVFNQPENMPTWSTLTRTMERTILKQPTWWSILKLGLTEIVGKPKKIHNHHNQPSFFLLKFNFCGVFPMFNHVHTHPSPIRNDKPSMESI